MKMFGKLNFYTVTLNGRRQSKYIFTITAKIYDLKERFCPKIENLFRQYLTEAKM